MKNVFHRLKESTFNLASVLFSLLLYLTMAGLGRIDDVESAQLCLPCTKVIFDSCYFTDMNIFFFLQ